MALGVPLIVSKPKANFAALTTLSCPNKDIVFKDSCVGLNLQYTWYFGDGATSNIANPVHHYTKDGLYSIKLVVTDEYGCTDSAIRLNYIKINTPYANFTMSDSLGTCSPLLINFTNTSANYKTINWDFGDGTYAVNDNPSHFYSTPGIYYAKLTIESEGGCIDTIKKQISVLGPSGNFSYGPVIGCTPTKIKFASNSTNAATFLWDFNDGFVVGTKESTISHTYTVKGDYVPKMILIDSSGCRLPLNGLDTIHIKEIAAGFTYSKKLFCGQGTVQFYDSTFSDDVIVKRQWDFDDGATSSDKNPEHFYSNTGIYYPKLITTTLNGCTDTATYSAPIKIIPIPQSQIVSKDNGCTPLNITFNGQLLAQDTAALTWNWDFANGATSNVQNPPATIYNIASNYAIKLIVTNSSGCADTVVKNIAAYPVPKVKAGADEIICFGAGVVLNAAGADSYSWSPSTNLSCADCQSPLAKPDSLINYIVKGTSNGNGCTSTDTVQIKVKHPFVLNNSLGDTLCVGSSKKLFAAGGYKYVWSPATGLSDANSATPVASPTATTLYTVISTDEKGCFKDTGYVPITVYSTPTINAGQDKTIIGGETATLPFVYAGDAASVTWAADPSILEITSNNITVKPVETTEYTVEVKSQGGCKAKDKVTVFVICSGANVFIPNTFSPNGDGANDKFYPRGKGLFKVKAFRIFNRWGELVFMKNDFMPNDENAGWDGTYKGQRLNPDVYVYTVDIQCNSSNTLALKGNITLIR